jgi:hypothetical protein
MKHDTILTKRQFTAAVRDSLFNPVEGHSLACLPKERFDGGKYKPGITPGRPVPEHMKSRVLIVWAERRKDSHGPYDALFSIPNPNRNSP